MIKYFDAFFGGHVEMDSLGFQGLLVDDRIESDEHLATVCRIGGDRIVGIETFLSDEPGMNAFFAA